MKLYPLKLRAVTKDIIWGGKRLASEYGKGVPGEKIAEAWTLTLRPDGENIIENGEGAGKTLSEYISYFGRKSVTGNDEEHFPLLVKLIDACDKLSVQVHPDDEYAHSHGLDAGKTEMWYIVDAAPGAKLVYGLNKDIPFIPDKFKAAAEKGELEKYLNEVEVHPGDVFFIPAGLVHAIGAGILIAEIQQNSNTTYRIYDYDRVGADGKKRELHIDSALETIKPMLPEDDTEDIKQSGNVKSLAGCDFFKASLLTLKQGSDEAFHGGKMLHLLSLKGAAKIIHDGEEYPISKGDGYLIPADMGDFSVVAAEDCEIILAEC